MSTDIENEIFENRKARNLQNGEGTALLEQVDSRDDMEIQDASQKFYRRKGTSTLGGFNQSQMYKDGVDPQVREDGSFVIPNQYRSAGTRTMFGVDVANGKKIEDATAGSIWKAPLRAVAGGIHDLAEGTVDLAVDTAGFAGADVSGLRKRRATYQEPKWLKQSSGEIEDIGRNLVQFITGYGGAAKAIGAKGFKGAVGASAMADATFDPTEGSIGTMFNDAGMLPEMLRFMDAKMTAEEHGEFLGRASLVLEGAGLGAGIETAARMFRAMKGSYTNYGDTLIQEGVGQYTKATGSLNHPTLGAQGTEILHQNQALDGLAKVAGGMQIKKGTVEQFMKYAADGGIDENLAKKAWNQASKNKLERLSGYVSQPSSGPIARQAGKISMFDGETISNVAKPADFESVAKYFDKQIARGNMQRSEMDNSIKPAMDYLKGRGIGSASPEQIIQVAKAKRPEFKTITKTDDAKFEQHIYRPADNTLVLDYKEHLFTARNDNFEGAEGYVAEAHFSEPFIKGIVRTSLMGKSAGPNQLKDSKIYIQEMQSDVASAARKYGEWSDEKIQNEILPKLNALTKEDIYGSGDVLTETLESLFGKPKTDTGKKEIKNFVGHLQDVMFSHSGDRVDVALESIRPHLATPSAFNQEKAWVRQTVRPVIEDAVNQGVDKIELASADIIDKRWQGTSPSDKYQTAYPKILKQYFKSIGVPEKDIHMPTKSSDSFWVKLSKDVMNGTQKLPQYSIAGSAPVSMKFGEENDK